MRDHSRDLLERAVLAKHTLEELLSPIADGTVKAEDALSVSEQFAELASTFRGIAAGDESGSAGTFSVEVSYRVAGVSRELRPRLQGLLARRDHGLDYDVTLVVVANQLDVFGTVIDLAGLQPFDAYLKDTFEHRLLNEVIDPDPSNERFACHLGHWFVDHVERNLRARLRSVRVTEPNGACAVWERPTR